MDKREKKVMQATTAFSYRQDPQTGCWVWTGYIDRNGYGRAVGHGKQHWAHRVVFEHYRGPIPEGLDLDHLCFNPPCVNPEHLEPVTRSVNMRRAYARRGKDGLHIRAALLRSQRLTYAEIAEVLDYSNKGGAASAVKAAIAKGLVGPDDLPAMSILTAGQHGEIRDLYALGVSQAALAEWYSIDSSHVSRLVNRRRGKS